MTTEGGLTYRDILLMDEKERMWWLQKCIDHNEKQEEQSKSRR
jgi:hypothetical protein